MGTRYVPDAGDIVSRLPEDASACRDIVARCRPGPP